MSEGIHPSFDEIRRQHELAGLRDERDEARRQLQEAMQLVEQMTECRRIFREGYLPPIPGESATIRGDALARLADILLDRKTQSDATGEAK